MCLMVVEERKEQLYRLSTTLMALTNKTPNKKHLIYQSVLTVLMSTTGFTGHLPLSITVT